MSKLKKIRDYLEQKLNEIVVEDADDKRPPKEWWDNCYATIKEKNPKYNDEQIRGTCGKIYHKMGVREKIGDFMDDLEDILPSETVKEPGSFREYCGGEVTDECIERGLNSDNKSIQAKAKLAKAFKTMRAQKKAKKKKDFQVVNDFVTTDFQVINDSTLGGYIVRDGPFDYNGIVKYKDWKNLKEAYGSLQKVIAFGSREQDSHTEQDDRMIGYFDDFKFIEKGQTGIYGENDVDENYNRIWGRLHTSKDIEDLSDLELDDLRNLPVSASYDDYGYGDKQIIGKIHHIAVSLNKNERDRCSTAGGTPCNVSLSQDHDHNLKEATTIADNDIKQGVLRADFSQPPTNKTKKMSTMENEKNKDQPEQEKDMSSTEKTEEEDEEVYDKEKKKDTAFDMDTINKIVEEKIKASIKAEPQVDMSEFKAIVDYLKSEKEAIETKKVQDLKEILIKPPYNYKEDSIKEMSLQELEHAKKLREMQSDFQPISGGATEINKEIFMKLSDFTPNMGYDPWAKVRQDFEGKRIVLKDEVLLVR